jgi:hypothetical protein
MLDNIVMVKCLWNLVELFEQMSGVRPFPEQVLHWHFHEPMFFEKMLSIVTLKTLIAHSSSSQGVLPRAMANYTRSILGLASGNTL